MGQAGWDWPGAGLCWPALSTPRVPIHRGAGLSDSEAEPDGEHNIMELPQAVAGRGNMLAQQSAVRLTEVRLGRVTPRAPGPKAHLTHPAMFPRSVPG